MIGSQNGDRPSQQSPRFYRRARFVMFGLTVVIIAAMTFAFEYSLGALNPARDGTPRHVRLREHPPHSLYTSGSPATDGEDVRVEADSLGFIVPSAVHDDPDLSIVFLGGSTTECSAVEPELRFPYLTGRHLEQATGLRVNTYNGGVSGNNSMHSNNVLINKVAPLEPDFVVLMHNVNDLGVLLHEGTYWNEAPTKSLVVEKVPPTVFSSTKQLVRTMVPNIYSRLRQLRLRTAATGDDEWAHRREEKIAFDENRIVAKFRSSLRLFVAASRALAMEPVLMTQGNRYSSMRTGNADDALQPLFKQGLTLEEYKTVYDRFNQTVREIAAEKDVVLIDLDRAVPPTTDCFSDGIHYTTHGSQIAAREIADRLAPRFTALDGHTRRSTTANLSGADEHLAESSL